MFNTFDSGAKKDNEGKLPYDLITKEMMDALAEGLSCGIKKGYDERNWEKGLPIMKGHIAASLRHIFKFMGGEDINVEKGKDGANIETHHLANAMVHLGMAITQIKRKREELDDRPKTPSIFDDDDDEAKALSTLNRVLEESKQHAYMYDPDKIEPEVGKDRIVYFRLKG